MGTIEHLFDHALSVNTVFEFVFMYLSIGSSQEIRNISELVDSWSVSPFDDNAEKLKTQAEFPAKVAADVSTLIMFKIT